MEAEGRLKGPKGQGPASERGEAPAPRQGLGPLGPVAQAKSEGIEIGTPLGPVGAPLGILFGAHFGSTSLHSSHHDIPCQIG